MKASSESGLWAQTISFTAELVIGERSHYNTGVMRAQDSLQTLAAKFFQFRPKLIKLQDELIERFLSLCHLLLSTHSLQGVCRVRRRARPEIRNRAF